MNLAHFGGKTSSVCKEVSVYEKHDTTKTRRTNTVGRFREYADSAGSHISVAKDGENTVMPWTMYAGMTEDDLGAIYSFLRTVKPVKNVVEKHAKAESNGK